MAFAVGVALIVWGAEAFAEHLGRASVQLGVSAFALALLLAGAEPEELATVVVASLRGSPGIAFGDVVGANVVICLVALGVGAVIWLVERRPPALGEVGELAEAREAAEAGGPRRVGRDLAFVPAGVIGMAGGATLLVEAVQRFTGVEATQTRLGLTLVGFATGFELVVLAWSAARRGISEAVVAGGSNRHQITAPHAVQPSVSDTSSIQRITSASSLPGSAARSASWRDCWRAAAAKARFRCRST